VCWASFTCCTLLAQCTMFSMCSEASLLRWARRLTAAQTNSYLPAATLPSPHIPSTQLSATSKQTQINQPCDERLMHFNSDRCPPVVVSRTKQRSALRLTSSASRSAFVSLSSLLSSCMTPSLLTAPSAAPVCVARADHFLSSAPSYSVSFHHRLMFFAALSDALKAL